MPESLSSFWIVKGEKLNFCISFKRTCSVMPFKRSLFIINLLLFFRWNRSINSFISVYDLAIWVSNLCYNECLPKILALRFCNVKWAGFEGGTVMLLALVSNFDWLLWKFLMFFYLRLVKCFKLLIPSFQKFRTLLETPIATDFGLVFTVSALLSGFFGTLIISPSRCCFLSRWLLNFFFFLFRWVLGWRSLSRSFSFGGSIFWILFLSHLVAINLA